MLLGADMPQSEPVRRTGGPGDVSLPSVQGFFEEEAVDARENTVERVQNFHGAVDPADGLPEIREERLQIIRLHGETKGIQAQCRGLREGLLHGVRPLRTLAGPKAGQGPLQALRKGAEPFPENGDDPREKKTLALLEGFEGGDEIAG
jgi:hypothetical protein